MDKKTKKKVVVLRERLQKLQKMLAGVKQQTDDPEEIKQLEKQIEQTKVELSAVITL